jgi:protease-4
LKLVDKLGYFDEFTSALNAKLGKGSSDKINFITLSKYNKVQESMKGKPFAKDKIAVIYAVGEIEGGDGGDDKIGSEELSAAIREARLDDKVKAIVMRVNSPGGSAIASEVIWREVVLAKKAKPFIISMGDVAASGGYYIACAADTIVAQPNTITGSIGVFGLMFNAQNMLKNKLGITTDSYKTSQYADLGTVLRPMTPSERMMIQHSVDKVYTTFTQRVADGRHMTPAAVDSMGQGRVWSAIDAKRIGLVDVLGGLDDAIKIAAKKAKLDNYRIKELPEEKEPFQAIMEGISGDAETWYMQNKLGVDYRYWNAANEILKIQGIQARSMYDVKFE